MRNDFSNVRFVLLTEIVTDEGWRILALLICQADYTACLLSWGVNNL